ncbi:astacin-like metalloendopeptidase [Mytilus californianus]|uniref:astacin-like metalloendopeptidase n=1 Tax=Mytilus californianus TaxID=6549 RepID=UPI00224736A6|nr:astacin-like metalloendopeptidase [Mytilus californianus]
MISLRLAASLAVVLQCVFCAPQGRSGDSVELWPFGRIPITFTNSVNGFTRERVLASIQEIQFDTYSGGRDCITYIPRKNEVDYVEFSTESQDSFGRVAKPGRIGGRQVVKVTDSMAKADIMQLLMYTMGSYNAFRRPDRDNFVQVNYDNIPTAFQTFFAKVNDTTFFKSPFDYNSVTFFYPFAYAKDPSKPTMQAKYEGEVFPWSVSLSDFDIENVRAGYGCGRVGDVIHKQNLLSGAVKCSFENDLCKWTQDSLNDFDFVRNNGPTKSNGTGPAYDYSNGIGYYALAEAHGHHNQKARLVSPQLAAGTYCLRFYYYMSGKDVNRATVNIRVGTVTKEFKALEGEQANQWNVFNDEFTVGQNFQVVLEAAMGPSDLGDIALDDVYYYRGRCIV